MKRLLTAALALFAASTFAATLNPVSLINPAGSTVGQGIVSTGATTAPVWGSLAISTLTGILPVAKGGTNASTASGTSLDNISGFSGTGFLTRTGAGTYAFQSVTNGITLANLNQAAANSIVGNSTGATASLFTLAVPSCSTSVSALNWTSGAGFTCNTGLITAATVSSTYATTAAVTTAISNQAALTFGSGQTLQDVKASRSLGTTFTNSTGRAIMVMVAFSSTTAQTATITVGAIVIQGNTASASGFFSSVIAVIPAGAIYSANVGGGTGTIGTWVELR